MQHTVMQCSCSAETDQRLPYFGRMAMVCHIIELFPAAATPSGPCTAGRRLEAPEVLGMSPTGFQVVSLWDVAAVLRSVAESMNRSWPSLRCQV